MALNFPSSPTLNQTYSIGSKTWKWNGAGWQIVLDSAGSVLTTRGDLLAYGAAPVRKAVGSNGQILMADSAQADGLAWVNTMGKNAIINGDFNIWQRGTSFVSVVDTNYLADRWAYIKAASVAVHDISRSTDVPTVAQAGRLFNYSMLVDCQTIDAAIGSTDLIAVVQRIEGFNWLPLAQRNLTLTFWVKATKTGVYCVSLRNSANDRSYVAEYTVNVTDTWEKKTVSIAASPAAGTWDYTTGVGAALGFTLIAGSTWQGTNNAWNSANNLATSNQVNACDSAANNFRLVGVQLQVGDVATEFESVPFQLQFARSQRYYQTLRGGGGSQPMLARINAGGANQGPAFTVGLRVTMRVAPTVTRIGTWTVVNCAQPGIGSANTEYVSLYSDSIAAGDCYYLAPTSADGLTLDSEL